MSTGRYEPGYIHGDGDFGEKTTGILAYCNTKSALEAYFSSLRAKRSNLGKGDRVVAAAAPRKDYVHRL